jgi:hypothetical protein
VRLGMIQSSQVERELGYGSLTMIKTASAEPFSKADLCRPVNIHPDNVRISDNTATYPRTPVPKSVRVLWWTSAYPSSDPSALFFLWWDLGRARHGPATTNPSLATTVWDFLIRFAQTPRRPESVSRLYSATSLSFGHLLSKGGRCNHINISIGRSCGGLSDFKTEMWVKESSVAKVLQLDCEFQ